MTAQSQTWDRLVEYFEAKIGKPPLGQTRFTPETDLYHDLDLNPPEISALLHDWGLNFGVDISEFDIGHYYPFSQLSKPAFFWTLLRSPFSRQARETLGGWQLTLGMLEEAMIREKWVVD
ncbi:acyl carrier protein [Caballeronia calidae]|uniref:Acyl carrier protein n=1 Tax=Caballeronia calidae TaxID=1777139 RepID=A0A158DW44_9BURK|nr:DUF1493 family protein [Caballeronia calidae]SAK98753.1 acyl carrier protein [Caballeronia calidae]